MTSKTLFVWFTLSSMAGPCLVFIFPNTFLHGIGSITSFSSFLVHVSDHYLKSILYAETGTMFFPKYWYRLADCVSCDTNPTCKFWTIRNKETSSKCSKVEPTVFSEQNTCVACWISLPIETFYPRWILFSNYICTCSIFLWLFELLNNVFTLQCTSIILSYSLYDVYI